MKYNGIDQQKIYSDENKTINDADISRQEPIGKLKIINNKLLISEWSGLFNTKTRQRQFVDDIVILKENGNKLPVILRKCGE